MQLGGAVCCLIIEKETVYAKSATAHAIMFSYLKCEQRDYLVRPHNFSIQNRENRVSNTFSTVIGHFYKLLRLL